MITSYLKHRNIPILQVLILSYFSGPALIRAGRLIFGQPPWKSSEAAEKFLLHRPRIRSEILLATTTK